MIALPSEEDEKSGRLKRIVDSTKGCGTAAAYIDQAIVFAFTGFAHGLHS
jgi:hypothetical protein